MRQDLETRLAGERRARDRAAAPAGLRPGRRAALGGHLGPLAAALDPEGQYTSEDLLDLTARAGAYVVESGTIEDRSLYRLYHRSLAEYLLQGRDQHTDQHAITTALARQVPLRPNGRPDWAAAHPYIRAYLAAHAAAGGLIDELSQDPGFLLAASPPRLLDALDTHHQRAGPGSRRRLPPRLAVPADAWTSRARRLHRPGRSLRACPRPRRPRHSRRAHQPWRPLWASWQLHRPHQIITGHRGPCTQWRWPSWRAARWWSPAAATARCGCGTWPPAAGRRPVHRARRGCARGGGGRAGGPPGGRLREQRRHGAGVGPGHRQPVDGLFTGHSGAVNAVAVGEVEGRPVVVSGSDDGTVRVWDLATGALVAGPFTGHRRP